MKAIKVLLFLFVMTYAALGVAWALNFVPADITKTYFEKTAVVFAILFTASIAITFIFKKSASQPSSKSTSNGPTF